jgi:hypothetical protein
MKRLNLDVNWLAECERSWSDGVFSVQVNVERGQPPQTVTWTVTRPDTQQEISFFKAKIDLVLPTDPAMVFWGPRGDGRTANQLLINGANYFQWNFGFAINETSVVYSIV